MRRWSGKKPDLRDVYDSHISGSRMNRGWNSHALVKETWERSVRQAPGGDRTPAWREIPHRIALQAEWAEFLKTECGLETAPRREKAAMDEADALRRQAEQLMRRAQDRLEAAKAREKAIARREARIKARKNVFPDGIELRRH